MTNLANLITNGSGDRAHISPPNPLLLLLLLLLSAWKFSNSYTGLLRSNKGSCFIRPHNIPVWLRGLPALPFLRFIPFYPFGLDLPCLAFSCFFYSLIPFLPLVVLSHSTSLICFLYWFCFVSSLSSAFLLFLCFIHHFPYSPSLHCHLWPDPFAGRDLTFQATFSRALWTSRLGLPLPTFAP